MPRLDPRITRASAAAGWRSGARRCCVFPHGLCPDCRTPRLQAVAPPGFRPLRLEPGQSATDAFPSDEGGELQVRVLHRAAPVWRKFSRIAFDPVTGALLRVRDAREARPRSNGGRSSPRSTSVSTARRSSNGSMPWAASCRRSSRSAALPSGCCARARASGP